MPNVWARLTSWLPMICGHELLEPCATNREKLIDVRFIWIHIMLWFAIYLKMFCLRFVKKCNDFRVRAHAVYVQDNNTYMSWLHCSTVSASLIISQASLDEPTHSIVMHHAKPNKLQSQALVLAEKVWLGKTGLEGLR